MQDELERPAESPWVSSAPLAAAARLELFDVAAAIAAAERATASLVFGDGAAEGDLVRALGDACSTAQKGERATLIAPAPRIASMRDAMRRAASARVGLVAHAIAGHGAEELAALSDLGWAVLCAAGPEDSFDLTVVAHRAAEDSGVPVIVVHGLSLATDPAGRAVAMVGVPSESVIQSFVGPPARARRSADGTVGDQAFAERVPFALGAALRDYSAVSGRRHDVFEKTPLGEASLVLVGLGPVGDALLGATSELRARGYDVGAVRVTSPRPFPGPRLVKVLARALAVTILEPVDEPLAHGGLLARDVKSAFTDALTWIPGFPGIGRVPKLFVGASGSTFEIADLAAVCENMLSDERGRRAFSFTDLEHASPRSPRAVGPSVEQRPEREIVVRLVLDDIPSAEVALGAIAAALASGLGLRAHGLITARTSGTGALLDVVASRERARGAMVRRAPRLVIATDRGVASDGAMVPLYEGAVFGVLGREPSAPLPETVRSALRERHARLLPLGPVGGEAPTSLAAIAAGAVLAVASRALTAHFDADQAARVVMESVSGPDAEASARQGRRAFESTRDVLSSEVRTEPDTLAHGRQRGIGVA